MLSRWSTLSVLLLLSALAVGTFAQDSGGAVVRIFDRIEENKGGRFWEDVRELETVSKGGLGEVRQGLTRADANVRIAAGAVLYATASEAEGLDALVRVMTDSKDPAARTLAARTIAMLVETRGAGDRPGRADQFAKLAGEAPDELSRVFLHRAVIAINESIVSKNALRTIFDKPSSPEVKDEAALALAQAERFQAVVGHLRTMASQTGEKARLAAAYLRLAKLAGREGRREDRQIDAGRYRTLDEILAKLNEHYHDPKKIDEERLLDAAARGMLASLDPYTAFYDEKMIEELRKEALQGRYGGIGARVEMRRNRDGASFLTILEPIFSGPAYEVGLRSNDTITEVEGEPTVNKDLSALVRRLRGVPNTPVTIKVYRRGWPREREFKITRRIVDLETTLSMMLPGEIGYVRLTTFGNLDEELRDKGSNIQTQIQALKEGGMKSLILDLRDNSGGYLATATRVASMFLAKDQLIVETVARDKVVEKYHADGTGDTEMPMIVLVDGDSASASEILAGALQAHKRALLVGERTYGKGSVQDLKFLETTQHRTAARMTIAKWLLPDGKSVERDTTRNPDGTETVKHEGGVEPDVKIAPPELDLWKVAEFEKLRADGKIEEYVTRIWEEHKAILGQLAETDHNDPGRYPGFDALYASLETKASREEVRQLLREFVRRRVQDDRKKAFPLDFQTDVQLQRGILEACRKAGVEAREFREYDLFATVEK